MRQKPYLWKTLPALVMAFFITVIPSLNSPIQGLRIPIFGITDEFAWDRIDTQGAVAYLRRLIVESEEGDQQEPSIWWARYTLAQLVRSENADESCRIFRSLAQEPNFPVREIARLRSVEACPSSRDELKRLAQQLEQPDSRYLTRAASKIGLDRAMDLDDPALILDFAKKSAQHHSAQADRLQFLRHAELAAQRLNLEQDVSEIHQKILKIAPRLKVLGQLESDQIAMDDSAPVEEIFEIADDLKSNRRFLAARSLYGRLIRNQQVPLDLRIKAYNAIASTFKLEGSKDQFLATLEEAYRMVTKVAGSTSRPETLRQLQQIGLKLARAHWTENNYHRAGRILENVKLVVNSRLPAHEIQWIEARISEERGDFQNTLKLVRGSLRQGARGESRERLLWLEAWTLRRLGDRRRAVLAFEELIRLASNNFDRNRYSYWKAKTLIEIDAVVEGEAQLAELAENDPLGYYGILAQRQLKRAFEPFPKTSFLASGNLSASPLRELARLSPSTPTLALSQQLEWLVALNEIELAQAYLDRNIDRRSLVDADPDLLRQSLKAFASAGHFRGLFEVFTLLPPDHRKSLLNSHPNYIFPAPFQRIVADASNRFGIPVELIYSIMRQESSFNAFARSPADAFGLMQLIPPTAGMVSERVGLRWSNLEELYSPNLNIPLGSSYLRMLWDRYDGQFILTVASYNASEEAVKNWVKTRYRGDPVEFIEDIPYEETRTYVRLVLRNFIFYLRLRSDQPLAFPEWCLDKLKDFMT